MLACIVASLGLAERAAAQSLPVRTLAPTRDKGDLRGEVPESHRPPPGLCRVWIDNVPPGQQPAPTDCASAIKNRPSNGRVIFPEDVKGGKRDEKDGGSKDERKGRGGKETKPRKPPV